MQLHSSLVILALAVSVNAQAFGGSPAGGTTPGETFSFPDCAKSCVETPKGNFVDQFSAFCSAVPTKDCCITSACPQVNKELTYQISQQICNYIGVHIAAFTCAPSRQAATDTAPSTQKGGNPNVASSSRISTKSSSAPSKPGSTTYLSASTPTTLSPSTHSTPRTSTHSTLPTSTHTSLRSSTHSTLRTSTRSSGQTSYTPTSTHPRVGPSLDSGPSSTKGSSTSIAPPSSHTTLSVYNGFVGAYCYTEGTSGRALTGNSTTSSSMTIETCLDFCEKTGWGWAGVENSSECYCGYGMVNGGARTDNSACNLGCAGNPSENCGGMKTLSVYQSG